MLCVSGFSQNRGKAPAWLYTPEKGLCFEDPGLLLNNYKVVFCKWIKWDFCETCYENFAIYKWKFCLKIYGVTSWYQSLGLRDSDAPSGVFGLKLRIWEKKFKMDNFSKMRKDFTRKRVGAVYIISQSTNGDFPKYPYFCVMRFTWDFLWDIMHARE